MSLFEHIKLPKNANATAVMNYLEAQHTGDESKIRQAFAEDVVFDGLMFKISGLEQFMHGFKEFTTDHLESIKVEAIAECADPDHYLAMYWNKFRGVPEEQSLVVCDHITLKDGKIKRVNNVFDVEKTPQTLKEMASKSAKMTAEEKKG